MILERNLCPDIAEIKELMLKEVVQTPCSIHSGSKKSTCIERKILVQQFEVRDCKFRS
jgi:hypothetical protein